MSDRISIRFADPARDAAAILKIYAPYIEKTAITFEVEVPPCEAFERRVAEIASEFPYLVMELDGEMIGYAYAHRQAERAAFGWNAELSIYLKEGFLGRGLGRPLYALLEELLAMQGYINFYGVITGSNTGSIAMHERMGYALIGRHARTGFKFGQWHDTVWLHKRIAEGEPGEIVPVDGLDGVKVRERIESAQKKIEEKLHM
ncbi:MAG: N-acetyltransferase [Clostridiales bacterium]|nr:N-acetyltransferase [Clostridiales bacterium]